MGASFFVMRLLVRLLLLSVTIIAVLAGGFWLLTFRVHMTLPTISQSEQADEVRVFKSARQLQLLKKGKVIGRYNVSLGAEPEGHKSREGDERTPEGRYVIDSRNASSSYYLGLHISYPNEADMPAATS